MPAHRMLSLKAPLRSLTGIPAWKVLVCACLCGALTTGVIILAQPRHRARGVMDLVPIQKSCCFRAPWSARLSSRELLCHVVQSLHLQTRWQCREETAVSKLRTMLRFPDDPHGTESEPEEQPPRPFRIDAYSVDKHEAVEILNALADEFVTRHAVLAEESRQSILALLTSKIEGARDLIAAYQRAPEEQSEAMISALQQEIAEFETHRELVRSGKSNPARPLPRIIARATPDPRLYWPDAPRQILFGTLAGGAGGLVILVLRRSRHPLSA